MGFERLQAKIANDQRPAISMILPIFNMEKHLRECIDSILAQTFSDFEVILVNDGSTDNSEDICKTYLSDARFRYIKQANAGVSVARNTGLNEARGTWIAFVDPDDKLFPNYLEDLYQYTHFDLDIISCCCKVFNSENEEETCSFYDQNLLFIDDDSIREENSLVNFRHAPKIELLKELMDSQYMEHRSTAIGVPWGKLYRSELLFCNKLSFDPKLIRMQDNIFNMYAFQVAKAVLYINKGLYLYRDDHMIVFSKQYDERAKYYYIHISEERRKFLIEHDLMKEPELRRMYIEESAKLLTISMKKYYANRKNGLSLSENTKTIYRILANEIYRDVMANLKRIKAPSKGATLRLWMLKLHMVWMVVLIEKYCIQ